MEVGINQESGMNIYTLLHKKQKSTKTYRMAQGTLYAIFCDKLRERRIWERMNIFTCPCDLLCCTPETNTTL